VSVGKEIYRQNKANKLHEYCGQSRDLRKYGKSKKCLIHAAKEDQAMPTSARMKKRLFIKVFFSPEKPVNCICYGNIN